MGDPRAIGTLILGGGIVGLCLALELARDGLDVLVADDGRQAGTTANAGSLHVQMQSRFIRLYPDAVPALERSLPLYPAAAHLWAELAAELGEDIELKSTGGVMVAETPDQYEFLARKCERERALGLTVAMLGRAEVERIAPYLGPAVHGAEFCAEEGKLNPLLANRAIRRAAAARGVVRLDETRATAIEAANGRYRVTTNAGVVEAGTLVIAAGAGTGRLVAPLGFRIPTQAEPLHMNVTEATAPLIGHLVQHADRMITLKQLAGGQVVVGGGWPARLVGEEDVPAVELDSMIGNLSLAQHIVPRLARLRVLRTWAGINTTTDGQCVIGRLPLGERLFVAVPGDAGYTLGPLVARLAASLVRGKAPAFDLAPYSPLRFPG